MVRDHPNVGEGGCGKGVLIMMERKNGSWRGRRRRRRREGNGSKYLKGMDTMRFFRG
jgi:hypothetical protein